MACPWRKGVERNVAWAVVKKEAVGKGLLEGAWAEGLSSNFKKVYEELIYQI